MKHCILLAHFLFLSIQAFAWGTPSISTPLNNSFEEAGVTFDWGAVASSESYEIQIDTSSSFNSPAFQSFTKTYINSSSSNNDTELFLTDLLFGTSYHWRVRAWVTGDTSNWSSTFTVNIIDDVTLSSPSDGSIHEAGVELDWEAHTGVDFYEVQLDTSLTFSSPAFRTAMKTYINSSNLNNDTESFFTDLYFDANYHWRVRAINAVDTTQWSTVRGFQTKDELLLTSPSDGTIHEAGLELDWEAHTGVDFYEVQLDTSLTFSSPAFRTAMKTYINSSNLNNDTESFFTDLYFDANYHWRVRAINAVDTTQWSTIRGFQTKDELLLTSTSNNTEQLTGLQLDWEAHTGVDFYGIQLDSSLTFSSPAFRTAMKTYINSSNLNNDTESFFADLYFGTSYYWRVRAINAVDTTQWSVINNFTTRDYVNLSSPADFALNQSVAEIDLNWNAHDGVNFYEVQWDSTNLFNSPLLQTQLESYISSSNSNNDTDHNTGALLSNQTYFWRVRAINTVDTSAWTSRVFSTGTSIVSPQIPVLISPSNGASISTTTATMNWNQAADAQSYEVEYSLNSNFNSPVSQITSNTDLTVSGLLNNNTYYWRVRSINGGVYSDWSTVWSFNINECLETTSNLVVSECESYTSPSGNYTWTTSNTYMDTIPNAAGCDSVITVDLTINNSTSGIDIQTACDSYTWIDGNTYTSDNNTATHTLTNAAGCDSVVTLDLTINTVDASISQSEIMLTANESGAIYAWLDCNTMTIISGETGQSFTATSNGDYAAVVTVGNCSDTSTCMNVNTVGVHENEQSTLVNIYPNPNNGIFNIALSSKAQVQITDLTGKSVLNGSYSSGQHKIDLSNYSNGVYLLKVLSNGVVSNAKIVKN